MVAPATDGAMTVEVKAGCTTDSPGNPNLASNLFQDLVYDTTAPIITHASASLSQSDQASEDSFTLGVRASETGTVYYVVLEDLYPTPSAQAIKTDDLLPGLVTSGSVAITSTSTTFYASVQNGGFRATPTGCSSPSRTSPRATSGGALGRPT